ncbi:hypothetical protein BV898_03018 [Hypsibius exemplaris]|uniref:G-protein coupled receptors family 1 profile domain-containing protein n=1 Tax=Hypsibius exemplaris TaxID=2072580 RepID=A0A1W0X5U4_HYPEX|nr:hypothetical protein BV898_03018 [Hypsibius exemplaris]
MNASTEKVLPHLPINNSTNCTVTWEEKLATQLPGFLLGALIIIAQLTNLIVFNFYRSKDHYILFHISLAISSLLSGMSLLSGNLLRYQDLTPLVIWLTKLLGLVLILLADSSALFAIFCISIDRWLSVEYPARYRSLVSRKKILFVIIIFIWTGSIFVVSAGMIRYWSDFSITPCSYRKIFAPQDAAFPVWSLFRGPIVLPFLLFSQIRIFVIGSSMKLRRWRGRASVSAAGVLQELQLRAHASEAPRPQPSLLQSRVFRIVWHSMLASMVVVIITLAINVPFIIFAWLEITTASFMVRVFAFLLLVQHCYSPLIYLCLFPHYRAVFVRAYTVARRRYNAIARHASVGAVSGSEATSRRPIPSPSCNRSWHLARG